MFSIYPLYNLRLHSGFAMVKADLYQRLLKKGPVNSKIELDSTLQFVTKTLDITDERSWASSSCMNSPDLLIDCANKTYINQQRAGSNCYLQLDLQLRLQHLLLSRIRRNVEGLCRDGRDRDFHLYYDAGFSPRRLHWRVISRHRMSGPRLIRLGHESTNCDISSPSKHM